MTGFRGCRKLLLGSYSFTKNKISGGKTYWSCARAGQFKCKARAISMCAANGEERLTMRKDSHNHEAF